MRERWVVNCGISGEKTGKKPNIREKIFVEFKIFLYKNARKRYNRKVKEVEYGVDGGPLTMESS